MKERKEGSNPTARQRGANRAEAREEFELERVISCCSREQRRRTELDFGSRKLLDDLHRTTALGTAPKTKRVFSGGNVLFGLRLWGRSRDGESKAAAEWHAPGSIDPVPDTGLKISQRRLRQ